MGRSPGGSSTTRRTTRCTGTLGSTFISAAVSRARAQAARLLRCWPGICSVSAVIDPAAANDQAIRSYSKVGFRPVGVMRQYERGGDGHFHDGLLMDLLRGELAENL